MDGRVAFLNAADDLVGMAIARALAAEGCAVACNHISAETAGRVARAVEDAGGKALVVQALLTNRQQVKEAVALTVNELGRLDVIVCNATWFGPTDLLNAEDRDWERWIERNLKAPMYTFEAALPHFLEAGYGKVVNVASAAGTQGLPGYSYYSAGKAGILGFTKAIAAEFASKGIRANAIAPAGVKVFSYAEEQAAEIGKRVPLGRMGHTEELAALAAYLAAPESDFITGQTFSIHGGLQIGIGSG
jgi:3-oxoacyl-[acyl-carrier protein] reductase